MELQLGLALPSNPSKGFDLNYFASEPKEIAVSNRSFTVASSCTDINDINDNNRKRSFDQTFENETDSTVPRTLPLLLWNLHPNEEDDPKDLENHSLVTFNDKKDGDNGDGLVGWPPIRSRWRNKRLCHENNGAVGLENGFACGIRGSNSTYVKVKMEGVPIARKIDLGLHHSFQTLTETLMDMFGQWWLETGQKDSNQYKLAYQDREGDWLFAEDVSWRTFSRSVQRIKLLKSSR
uniref:Auxin-responsive protein n=1 Tax=Carya cathayensis TaxID=139927 RepID=A0A2R3XZ44_9ROSI|nr:Aux/IAA29b [Carya cathayensis]